MALFIWTSVICVAERPESRGLPHFILGQSMGGAVTLKVHLKEPQGWDGVVLVAPMCKVRTFFSSLRHSLRESTMIVSDNFEFWVSPANILTFIPVFLLAFF